MRAHAQIAGMMDALLEPYAGLLGRQFTPYRNHACRVASFFRMMSHAEGEALEKLAIAAAFHDLGIWTARTFDYIEPSVSLAAQHVSTSRNREWSDEIAAMIRLHHKVTPCPDDVSPAVELFRRADWVDVSAGALRFGLSPKAVAEVRRAFPLAGFHCLLFRLALRRLVTHPMSPLPMLRW